LCSKFELVLWYYSSSPCSLTYFTLSSLAEKTYFLAQKIIRAVTNDETTIPIPMMKSNCLLSFSDEFTVLRDKARSSAYSNLIFSSRASYSSLDICCLDWMSSYLSLSSSLILACSILNFSDSASSCSLIYFYWAYSILSASAAYSASILNLSCSWASLSSSASSYSSL
jgi:hypothetical protein